LSQQPIPGILPRWRDWSGPLRDSLFGLAPDGVFRAVPLTRNAVRSYRTFSPLPTVAAVYDRRTFAGVHRAPLQFRRFVFCGTVRRKAFWPSARVYPGQPGPGYAASRPLVFGLSSPVPFGGTGAILHPPKTWLNLTMRNKIARGLRVRLPLRSGSTVNPEGDQDQTNSKC